MDYITKRLSIIKQSIQTRSETPEVILRACLDHITNSLEYTESLPFPMRVNTPRIDHVTIRYNSKEVANTLVANLKQLIQDLNLTYVNAFSTKSSTSGPYDVIITVDLDLVP